jgi:thiol-disulfide isomerase/thioredoxin
VAETHHSRSRGIQVISLWLLILILFVLPQLHAQRAASALVGRHAPGFSRMDLSGKPIELGSYRGKVVLLNFWATWCGPCLTEMPTFTEWQTQFGSDKFQVIGVSMDDAAPEVIAVVSKLKLNYPVIMGDEHLGVSYGGVLGLPVTFLIGRDGQIHDRYDGAADLPLMKGELHRLLGTR